jgi:hypothetical protein
MMIEDTIEDTAATTSRWHSGGQVQTLIGKGPMPTLYHRTTAEAAKAILDSGFHDKRGHYGFDIEVEGVWLSDVPLDAGDFGPLGQGEDGVLLAVTLDGQDLIDCEVVAEGNVGSYREWLVPAAVINARGRVRLVSANEEEEAASGRFDLTDDSKGNREGG